MPQGVERFFPSITTVFFGFHAFAGNNSLLIIPAQFKYRYASLREMASDK
jgi:hypothetical protein